MRGLAAVAVVGPLLIPTAAQQREPIIDVHMHALAADAQGPPPLAMCTPSPEYSAWDPATPYRDLFIANSKKPACADPIWSPAMDHELMNQTVAIADRRNIVGVLSGPAARVAAWVKANPRRFIRALTFQLGDKDTHLQAIVDAGFTNRVMFGSDQMVWPGTIERAIAVIDEAPFLSKQQKRDIFYPTTPRTSFVSARKSSHGTICSEFRS